jgi:hypothetical protein
VISDAPALSTDGEAAALGAKLGSSSLSESNGNQHAATVTGGSGADPAAGGEWDDDALAASYARKGFPMAAATTVEVLDMKALDAKRLDQDDIAERLRIEETRAQLAAAKEGMEREAQRLKQEREKKEDEKKPADELATTGGKWLPPHLRAGAALQRVRPAGFTGSQKLDTQDENLFPDLSVADAILEKQKGDVAYKVPKKTAVGGGATWGSRAPVIKSESKPEQDAAGPDTSSEFKVTLKEAESAVVPEPEPSTALPPEAGSSASDLKKKLPTKKKKKDLSTFKPSSS